MWQCSNCGEFVEEMFDLCWNCGTARDGTIGPDFRRESDVLSSPHSDEDVDITQSSTSGTSMNRREIAALICKTLALLMFAQAAFLSITGVVLIIFMFLTAPFHGWIDWNKFHELLILSIPLVAVLVVGIIYWRESKSIATRMVSADPAPVTNLSITVQDVMMVAFSTAGLFILVDGVRDFIAIVFLAHSFNSTTSEFWYNGQTWAALVQLGLGLWLVLGSHGIVGAICWLRTAGMTDPDDG